MDRLRKRQFVRICSVPLLIAALPSALFGGNLLNAHFLSRFLRERNQADPAFEEQSPYGIAIL